MRRLMIVDDEPLVRSLIKGCIDWSALGIEVSCEAGDAAEALQLLKQRQPDIACVDVCMPGTSGIELSREMLEARPDLQIVVISGHDTFEYVQQCLRLGVGDYLLKPINEEQLTQAMARALGRLQTPAGGGGRASGRELDAPQARASVKQVIDYLREHYADPELGLQSAARALYVNASYLSRAVKQDTGSSFIETLTRLRMEAAQRLLLETGLTGYQVGERVGIPDPKYFGACFKKHTGMTVREFRRHPENKR